MEKGQRQMKRFAMGMLALVMATVTACSTGGDGSAGNPSNTGSGNTPATGANNGGKDNVSEAPFEMRLMYNFDGVEFPPAGNEVHKQIEELTNTTLRIEPLPGSAFEERLPVMLASGDLPTAVPIPRRHQKLPYVVNAVNSGLFWEIGPYLEQFPNLMQINPAIYDNILYDGKLYGLPRVRPLARRAFHYRADWVENLGLQEPKTIEDFYNMLVAFKNGDPDGNGQDDTGGLVMMQNQIGRYFTPFFGAPNQWELRDGEFIRDAMTDEFLEALKFEKRLYDENLLNRDFAIMDRPEWTAAMETGRAGVRNDVTGSATGIEEAIQENNPDAQIGMFSVLEGDHGKRVFAEGGHNGFYLFPKSSLPTEEDLLKALGFFDTLAGEEGANLMAWGIEGTHYELVDGKPKHLEDGNYGEVVGASYSAPLSTLPAATNAMQGEKKPLDILAAEIELENEGFMVADPTLSLISETYLESGAQLETILEDAHVKFVMGEINEEQWRAQVELWRSRGGDKIAAEYAEAYARANQ